MDTPDPIVIVDYDAKWPREFAELGAALSTCLGTLVERIEHVGSTAVLGLAAKPILDIDVVIGSTVQFDRANEALTSLGYRHVGDRGVPTREAFDRSGMDVPRTVPIRDWMSHHLYVCTDDSPELRRHLAFRDALRSDRILMQRYAALKRTLAAHFLDDREGYCEAKSAFVEAVLRSRG